MILETATLFCKYMYQINVKHKTAVTPWTMHLNYQSPVLSHWYTYKYKDNRGASQYKDAVLLV